MFEKCDLIICFWLFLIIFKILINLKKEKRTTNPSSEADGLDRCNDNQVGGKQNTFRTFFFEDAFRKWFCFDESFRKLIIIKLFS